ncbi:MAG: prephenate dehydrogenase/arogenate dehydrogenase family protein [Solirubrobacterales bacterium]
MKLAVLGVGLIGGSIGLAARERLGASVAGYDPDPSTLRLGSVNGALSRSCTSVEQACAGADVVLCCAPVGRLPDLVGQALVASGSKAVVTDVGSVKGELCRAHSSDERFIGGHPLAGAETAGIEHARADLFDGARWYLTPGSGTRGTLYDRLQRLIADLGARPQAIDAETHDRELATVSHLPHVLANVLVSLAATAPTEGDRPTEIGPSFRDATRVAGANPAMWRDIFLANGPALATALDTAVDQLRDASELVRAGDDTALLEWIEQARADRARLAAGRGDAGPAQELRVTVANRPGVVAELALALGRAGVNIEDMSLHPAHDGQTGAISLWVTGDQETARARELVQGLGHAVTRSGGQG